MQQELFEGFKIEMAAITKRLTAERAALAGIEDGEEAAIARNKISTTESLLAAVEEARGAILHAEAESVEGPQKFVRWRQAVAKVREAQEDVEAFVLPIQKYQAEVDVAENSFVVARAALTDHRNRPVENRDYASQAVIRKWEARCAELEAAVSEQSGALRTLKEKLTGLRTEWLRATDHLTACAFTARMLNPTPKTPPESPQGVGVLSAVY